MWNKNVFLVLWRPVLIHITDEPSRCWTYRFVIICRIGRICGDLNLLGRFQWLILRERLLVQFWSTWGHHITQLTWKQMSMVVEKQSWKALHNYKSRYAPDVTRFGCFLCIYGRLVVDHPKFRIIICWAWFDFGSLWQVQLFDSMNYLKSFSVGDVWVAVGWSSDVIPAAKRMSNVAVVVPKSGSSLWADLWVWYGCLMNNALWICTTKLSISLVVLFFAL